jgi:prolipoprotein diacylglyceryltransferase
MHPILVELGPWRILAHDAFSVLAVVIGFAIYYRELRRRAWLDGRIVAVSIAAVVGALIGARVITAWEHLEYYTSLNGLPLTVAIEQSGKSLIGALAGGYLGIALAKRATGYSRL